MINECVCIPHFIVIPSEDLHKITAYDTSESEVGDTCMTITNNIMRN